MNAREHHREALIAYWNVDGCSQRAENLWRGWPFDYLDDRAVTAIEAFNAAMADKRVAA